jgi:macrolide transport system ATP-binding/permease protein
MGGLLDGLWGDLRLAVRGLIRRPGFTAVALLSLALGIGANTAVFTAAKALFRQSLPVREPERLVAVFTHIEAYDVLVPVSYLNFVDLRERSSASFSSLFTATPVSLSLTAGGSERGKAEPVDGQMVSGDYFDALGVRASLGRTFLPEEDGAPGGHPVVVLGDGLWRRRFGGDPGILGRTLLLNNHEFTVIGVAPRGFEGTGGLQRSDFWVPLAMHDQVLSRQTRPFFEQRRATLLGVLGRLRDGVTPEQARADLRRLAAGLTSEYPEANQGRSLTLLPLAQSLLGANERQVYVMVSALLAAIAGSVLLIACANVANMLLARAAGRRREVAVRLALGARRGQLIRQLLMESVVLSVVAGALGLLFAVWSGGLLTGLRSPLLPPGLDFGIDPRVLLFTLGLSLLTALLFGLVPALQASRPELVGAIKGAEVAARRKRRPVLRNLLVVGQMALSLIALVGAALFLLSLRNAQRIDPGFEKDHLLTVSFDLDSRGYDPVRGEQVLERMVETVEALPGVRSAAVAEGLVLGESGLRRIVARAGEEPDPDRPLVTLPNTIGPGYFETLGIPVLRGRAFDSRDRAGTLPVAMINQTMADQLWPGIDPVGRRFLVMPHRDILEVIGVVRNAKYVSLGEPPLMVYYVPLSQSYASAVTLHVRTEGDPGLLAPAVRRELTALEPELPLQEMRTMSQVVHAFLWAPRAGAGLLTLFGLLALVLAVVGIYGVMSYSVSQRHREIGIRIALGADRGRVIRLFLKEGMMMVAAGLFLGLILAFLGSRVIASLLYGIGTSNAPTLAATALLLALIALAATWIPARRATAVPPQIVMRQD